MSEELNPCIAFSEFLAKSISHYVAQTPRTIKRVGNNIASMDGREQRGLDNCWNVNGLTCLSSTPFLYFITFTNYILHFQIFQLRSYKRRNIN